MRFDSSRFSARRTLALATVLSLAGVGGCAATLDGDGMDDSLSVAFEGAGLTAGRLARMQWPDGAIEYLPYVEADGYAVVAGDILAGPVDEVTVDVRELPAEDVADGVGRRADPLLILSRTDVRWRGGIVPYVIDAGLPDKARVTEAIAHVESRTSIRFVVRTSQPDYVRFRRGTGCSAHLGHIGGEQFITLGDGCSRGSAIHEIVHALGVYHTQQRPDRDDHVRIHWDNIQEELHSAFRIRHGEGIPTETFGPYETFSIMHYPTWAFAIDDRRPTISLRGGGEYDWNRTGLTRNDAAGVNHMYAHPEVTGPRFCPFDAVTREQMATFLVRVMHGVDYSPPAPTGRFADVAPDNVFIRYIEQLARDGITRGCGGDNFCPRDPVTREQMATFLVRAMHGTGFSPPAPTGRFADVAADNVFIRYIEQLARDGITRGCGGDNFCPNDPVTREQMATFLVRVMHGTSFAPPPAEHTFVDVAEDSPHERNIEQLYSDRITRGCGGSR